MSGPVASPELAAQVRDVSSLATLPRLHTRTFMESWAEWEAAAGVVLPPAAVNREFDHYFYMLEAAAAGLGGGGGARPSAPSPSPRTTWPPAGWSRPWAWSPARPRSAP